MSDSREYPASPIVGVGVVVLRGDRCLVVRRGRPPSQGAWSIPGGRVEIGETLREAAGRELREECGTELQVSVEGIAFILDRITRDPESRVRYHFVLVDFVAEHVSGEPRAGSDAAEARWVTLAELSALPTTPRLSEILGELLRRRESGELGRHLPIEDSP